MDSLGSVHFLRDRHAIYLGIRDREILTVFCEFLGNRQLLRNFNIKRALKGSVLITRGSDSLFLNKNQTTAFHLFFLNFVKEYFGLQYYHFYGQLFGSLHLFVRPYKCIQRNTILLFITLKVIKMQYLEQLRLLFILFMAYLSYRKLNNTLENHHEAYAIQSEEQSDQIMHEEMDRDQLAGQESINRVNVVENVENDAQVEKCQPEQRPNQQCVIIKIERKTTEETADINEKVQDSQEQSEQNQSISQKANKTKAIKKQARKGKKKASLQTIITSENQQIIDYWSLQQVTGNKL